MTEIAKDLKVRTLAPPARLTEDTVVPGVKSSRPPTTA